MKKQKIGELKNLVIGTILGITIGVSLSIIVIEGTEMYRFVVDVNRYLDSDECWKKYGCTRTIFQHKDEVAREQKEAFKEGHLLQGEMQPSTAKALQVAPEGGEAEAPLTHLIREAFPEDPETAIAIAKAESGLRADAVGDGHLTFWKDGKEMGMSCGLFQVRILEGRPDCETLKDPKENIEYARKIYERTGWLAWSAYTNGKYLSHL